MIISDKYKLIFIRIPKTGSTSVEDALIKADPDCISSDNNKVPYGHFSAKDVKDIYHVGEYRWNNYFKFCTIREPLDWYMSMYLDHAKNIHYKNTVSECLGSLKNMNGQLPYHDGMKEIGLEPMLMLNTLNSRWYKPDGCTLQVDWLNAGDMDLIIDFSKLKEGWDIVKEKKRVFDVDLEKLNENSIRKNNRDVKFSKDAQDVFSIIHAKDIEFYNNLKN